eukprot:NODE_807_length_3783_cov_0.538002.p2 type:complete len:211 gc:universal NODE_807_length_3783_cov_0.538002:1498-2130(+)
MHGTQTGYGQQKPTMKEKIEMKAEQVKEKLGMSHPQPNTYGSAQQQTHQPGQTHKTGHQTHQTGQMHQGAQYGQQGQMAQGAHSKPSAAQKVQEKLGMGHHNQQQGHPNDQIYNQQGHQTGQQPGQQGYVQNDQYNQTYGQSGQQGQHMGQPGQQGYSHQDQYGNQSMGQKVEEKLGMAPNQGTSQYQGNQGMGSGMAPNSNQVPPGPRY